MSTGLVIDKSSLLLPMLPSIGRSCGWAGGGITTYPSGVFDWHRSKSDLFDAENSFFFVSHLSSMHVVITSTHRSFLHWQLRRLKVEAPDDWLIDSEGLAKLLIFYWHRWPDLLTTLKVLCITRPDCACQSNREHKKFHHFVLQNFSQLTWIIISTRLKTCSIKRCSKKFRFVF